MSVLAMYQPSMKNFTSPVGAQDQRVRNTTVHDLITQRPPVLVNCALLCQSINVRELIFLRFG